MRGADADRFIRDEDYTTYLQTYLMPHLIGVRAHMGRIDDIASSSRAQAPRGGARKMPHTRHSVRWPNRPTELIGWRYSGVPYQIPLEPPLLDHRYVKTLDSLPVYFTAFIHFIFAQILIHSYTRGFNLHLQPSIEYVEGLLEVMASFEGMILRRGMMLNSYGI